MHIFNYSFLDNGLLPANLVSVTSGIYSLQTAAGIRKTDFQNVFTELEKIAKVQSVKSSNAIEGIITSDKRINEIVNKSSAPLNHDEMEIAGYRDALNLIHTNYENLDFNISDILRIHQIMLTHLPSNYGGKFKTENNVILEIDNAGNSKVRFAPVPAKETAQAMNQLCLAFYAARQNSNINQLLLIPCVILDFLCIHPFKDGNGRMSRLLSLLLLYKNRFDAGKYISFEEQINKNKDLYYSALKKSSDLWHENQSNYFPFMNNFLTTLYVCYKELDSRFAIVNGKKINKTQRIEATVLNSLAPISKSDICKILPDISPTTVEAVLGAMVKAGRIKKVGSGRGTGYIRAK